MDSYEERLKARLSPATMALAFIRAGALLTGYELVKSSILDGVRGFFTFGHDENGPIVGPEYEQVRRRDRNLFRASVQWLVEMGGLTENHVAALELIRDHRGEVAHELTYLLTDVDKDIDVSVLLDLQDCIHALDRFWGGIEVSIDPNLDYEEIDLDGIRSGPGLLIDYLVDLCGLSGVAEMSDPAPTSDTDPANE